MVLKNINETRNYFLDEIKQDELMNKNHKKVCKILNYIKQILILAYKITGCISIPVFPSLFVVPIKFASSAIELKICAIATGIKEYKSIIKKSKEAW